MTDSLAMRGANAATGFVLSSLLVCGVIVVSDTGTYAIPLGNQNVPSADDVELDAPTDPADARRSSTLQTITVPVTLRPPRQARGRGGAGMALPASVPVRPDQQQTPDRSGDSKPGRSSFTPGASPDRANRAEKTSSRRSATSARDSRDTAPDRSAFRSSGSRTAFRRGA